MQLAALDVNGPRRFGHETYSPSLFHWEANIDGWNYTALVTFLLDADGRTEYLRERYFVGTPLKASGGAAAASPISLSPQVLQEPIPRFILPPDAR